MALELRRKPDGTLKSKYWYGAYTINGKRQVKNLGIEIVGKPPPSLRKEGDKAFERSRGKAEEKLKHVVEHARTNKTSEALIQNLHEVKYGSTIEGFPIKNLLDAWEVMPKKRRHVSPRYAKDVKRSLQRFLDYLAKVHPHVEDAAQVDRKVAHGFMRSEEARNITDKTWNDALKRVRAVFRFLQAEYGIWRNPFEGIKLREEIHRHRKPLAEPQVKALLKVIENDDFCRPLITCGLSTAMRLGDCCRLRWADVDFPSPAPSLTVKTSKTGEVVCIPIYDRLAKELEAAWASRIPGEKYVWPEQAKLIDRQHSLVSRKIRTVFNKAVGKDIVHEDRGEGQRRASVFDFHSLRTTWITEALSRGVPIETVKRISGHKTVEVVTKHYFHPSKQQVRQALELALPHALTGGEHRSTSLEDAVAALENINSRNWEQKRDEALDLLRQHLAS